MHDTHKTETQLITELEELRLRVAQLEAEKTQPNHTPFRLLAETAASAIFIFQDSVFRYTNPAASKLSGYTAEELLGANIWNLVHPEHSELIKERMEAWQRGEPVPHRSEFKILTKSGETRWIDADSTFIEFEGNLASLTIAYDSTDHKRAEEALNESEQRYRKIIETAQEAIWVVDAEANSTYVNQHLADMLGYTKEELLGRSVFDFVDAADRVETRRYLERGKSGIKEQHDFRLRRRDGSELWTMVSTTPLFDSGGSFVGGLAMLIDITERRRSEEALRKSEERWRTYIEQASDLIFILDKAGRMISVNKSACETTGYAAEEMLEKTPIEFVVPEQRAVAAGAMRSRLAGLPLAPIDLEILSKDGRRISLEVRGRTLYDGNEVNGAFEIARDITDRKRGEEGLRESEAKFRVLAETAASMIFIYQDSRCVYVNPYSTAFTGYSDEELLSIDFLEIVHSEHRELVRERVAARLRGVAAASNCEVKIVTRGGEARWIDFAVSPLEFQGKPAVLGTAFDITERKRVEEALRTSQERLQHVLSFSPAIIYLLRLESESFTIEWVSDSLTRLTGYEPAEALAEGWWIGHLHPEDRRRVLAELPRLLTGDRLALEFRFQHKDGGYLWVHNESRLLRDRSGKPAEVVGSWADVTERREAEVALRDSEERFRTLVGSMDDIVFTVDRELRYSGVFGRRLEKFRRDREIIIGKTASEILGAEAGRLHEEANERALAGEQVVYEWSMPINRETRHFHVSLSPIPDQSGKVAGLVGVGRDITASKQAGEALRESQERFRRYFELGLIGMAMTSSTKGFLEVNDQLCEMLGYQRSELLQMTWAEFTHPDDLAADVANFNRVMAGELDGYTLEKRFIRKDGQVIHATISVKCMRCGDGSVDYFVALIQDITERKRAEQALRESQWHLQAILDNCPAMIFLKDLDGRYLQVNRQFELTFRLRLEDVLGGTDAEVFPPELAAAFRATDRAVLEAGRSIESEERSDFADGPHTFIVHKFPLQDGAGNVYAVGGISTDITARKRAEDDLRKQKEILQKIFDHIPVMIRFLDEDGRVRLVNREWERSLGWSLEEIESQNLDIFAELYPDRKYRQKVLKFIAESNGRWADLKTRRRDGQVIETSWANVRVSDGTNVGIGRDITERKRADELLRRQTAQLAALHEIGLEISAEGELSRVLDVATRRAAELLNAYHCSVYIRDLEQAELNLVASLHSQLIGLRLKEGEGLAGRVAVSGVAEAVDDYSEWQGRASTLDPKEFGPVLGAPLKWQQTVIGAICLARQRGENRFTEDDIHFLEQIAAEAAIAIHHASLFDEVQEGHRRLRVLSHRLIDAQEAERKRLARELHDQIGQALTAVQINLQCLQASSATNGSADQLSECLAVIDEALQEVHDLSLDLRPSLLDDLGLVAALRWYVDRVASRAGLVHRFKADDLDTRLAPEVETACFRIAQEALTNVLRHASARKVAIEIKYGNSGLRLLVRDNGVGFDVRAAMTRTGLTASLGLQGMQERAAAVGGGVHIESKLGRGTKVQATFLLKPTTGFEPRNECDPP